jgi:hypothetical protein
MQEHEHFRVDMLFTLGFEGDIGPQSRNDLFHPATTNPEGR